MEGNFIYYIMLLALIVIGFLVVKKVASCMIKSIVTIVLIVIAMAMCTYGAFSGEMEIIFTKAVRICMECIGLG